MSRIGFVRLPAFAIACVLAMGAALLPPVDTTLDTANDLLDTAFDPLADCDDLDEAACLLPFPNDRWTRPDPTTDTGKRVDIPILATPRNVGGKPIDTTEWNRNDGFSPGSLIMTVVPNIDLEATGAPPLTDVPSSLEDDSPIVLLNAETGERHPIWAELDAWNDDPERTPLLIRPGVNLDHGARYIVALRNLVDSDGKVIEPGDAFVQYRDAALEEHAVEPGKGQGPPDQAPAHGRRAQNDHPVFGPLQKAGIKPAELYLAWDFTVASARSMFERVIHMRDDAFADLGDDAPNFLITDVEEHPASGLARRVTGYYEVPNYLDRPGGPPTSRLNNHLDPDGIPDRFAAVGTVWAPFWCNVPLATTADAGDPDAAVTPGRAGLYGHGLLGSGSQVSNGYVRTFADAHNFAFCATDWWGMATEDIPNVATILADMSNFPTLPDRAQQGFLNFLFLGRLMIHEDGFLADDAFRSASGEALWDASDLFYYGNSQGGIMGGALMAIAQDFTRGVLGVPGMNYSTLLDRSTGWATYYQVVEATYPDRLDHQIIFSMIQMLWDRGEANGFAHHMTEPYDENTPAKKIMLQVAFADHQVSHTAAEVEARTIGAHVHQPDFLSEEEIADLVARGILAEGQIDSPRHHDDEPHWGIPAIPYDETGRWDGSALIVWDSGNDTPPITNINPRDGGDRYGDPHGHPRVDPDAMLQMSLFLQTGGWIQNVCGGPCLSMQHPAKSAPHTAE